MVSNTFKRELWSFVSRCGHCARGRRSRHTTWLLPEVDWVLVTYNLLCSSVTDGIPRLWLVHLRIRFPLRSAAARLSRCWFSWSLASRLPGFLLHCPCCFCPVKSSVDYLYHLSCVEMGITIKKPLLRSREGCVRYWIHLSCSLVVFCIGLPVSPMQTLPHPQGIL